MINRIIPQHQGSLTYLQKAQYNLFKNTILIAMVLFTSYVTPQSPTYEGGRNQDGKYHGKGTLIWSNGQKYVGEFKDGKWDGQGVFAFFDKSYVGEFKDDEYHGQGTFTFSNVKKYVGEWGNGRKTGEGTS